MNGVSHGNLVYCGLEAARGQQPWSGISSRSGHALHRQGEPCIASRTFSSPLAAAAYFDAPAPSGKDKVSLVTITWSVCKLAITDLDILEDLDSVYPSWSMLLLQEFFGGRREPDAVSRDGHMVLFSGLQGGSQRLGIIVNSRLSSFVVKNSFQHLRRAISIDFDWAGDAH